MSEAAGRTKAILAAMLGAGLIGLAPIWVRASELGPQATNFWRFVFALPILGALAATSPGVSRRELSWLVLAGVLFGFELGLWATAVGLTTIANATLLTNMTPVVAAVFGWIVFKERLGPQILFGGAVALAGAVTLTLARAQSGQGPANPELGWVGDGLAMASAFGYAGYLLIVRSLRDRVSVGAVMFWSSLTGGVFALGAALLTGEMQFFPTTLQGWLVLVGLGVVCQAGGQGLIAYGVARLPIVVSTVLLWTQPVVAAALSWLLFNEALGPTAALGGVLILAGIFMVQRARA
jgi:drug/metabolite transporter (DMT)-like permease